MGGPFVPRGGVVTVPDGPGLGVSLDAGGLERAVERFAREGAYDYYPGQPPPRY